MQQSGDKLLSCLYSCLKKTFTKWAAIAYRNYPADFIEHISDNSFTDCIIRFKVFVQEKRLYNGNAAVKTVVFSFFRNTLRENLQKENRQAAKYQLVNIDEAAMSAETEETDKKNERLHIQLESALRKMKEEDRKIIIWRHIEEKSNDEIARLLQITVPSATNRIYRCMERLKALLDTDN
ncbi:MAG: sigma-70 family RNA polymerase sigma factor [Bacteroidetes bacterium]|nr:sigma-70 family RNA polymerase sigma factor [Bacteroidota bacterium]